MRNKNNIIKSIFYSITDGEFEQNLITALETVNKYDRIKSEYEANRYCSNLWHLFKNFNQSFVSKGIYPYYEITDDTLFKYRLFHSEQLTDTKKSIILKNKLKRRFEIKKFIDELSWREYESVGCYISQLCGANNNYIHLTPSGNERGIDFLSIIPAYGKFHLFPNHYKRIKLIGQSKKWDSSTPRERVSLMNDSIENIRRKNSDVLELIPDWFLTENGSYQGIIFSHSGYQSGALDLAREYGIITADSFDLTEIISLKYDLTYDIDKITKELENGIKTFMN